MNKVAFEVDASSTAELTSAFVVVEPGQMADFHKTLEKLNTKAKRFGLQEIRVLDIKPTVFERRFEYVGKEKSDLLTTLSRPPEGAVVKDPVILNQMKLEYPLIKLGAWEVVGRLEAFEDSNLFFSITESEGDRSQVREAALHPIHCEHCNTKRKRKDSFILRDTSTGEFKQVGNTCLEDFTGIDPAAALFLADMYKVVRAWEGEMNERMSSGSRSALHTQTYLAGVSFLSSKYGFVSSKKAREEGFSPTYADAASLFLDMEKSGSEELRSEWEKFSAIHMDAAKAVLDWVAAKPVESDFDSNVKQILGRGYINIDPRHMAFAAAAVAQYARVHAAAAQAVRPSEFVGAVGGKLVSALTVKRVIEVPNHFSHGMDHRVLMADAQGNQYAWKTGSAPRELVDGVGKTFEGSFKIKAHDEYKGTKQTSVSHLKVLRWMDSESVKAVEDSPAREFSTPEAVLGAIVDLVRIGQDELKQKLGGFAVATSDRFPEHVGVDVVCDEGYGVTYLLADRIPVGRESAVFLREVIGRHGRKESDSVSGTVGRPPLEGQAVVLEDVSYAKLLSMAKSWGRRPEDSTERSIHDAAAGRVVSVNGGEDEFFAFAVEEAVAMGVQPSALAHEGSAEAWLGAVVQSIQRVTDRLIGNSLEQLGAQDLVDLAYAMAQVEREDLVAEDRWGIAVALGYPSVLESGDDIAAYMRRHAGNDDFSEEFAREYLAGAAAVKRLVAVSLLVEGNPDANVIDPERAAAYKVLPVETMPPLIVEDGQVLDGGHRLRELRDRGVDSVWIYDVIDEDDLVYQAQRTSEVSDEFSFAQ